MDFFDQMTEGEVEAMESLLPVDLILLGQYHYLQYN